MQWTHFAVNENYVVGCWASFNPNDIILALIFGYFLTQEPLGALPELDLRGLKINWQTR